MKVFHLSFLVSIYVLSISDAQGQKMRFQLDGHVVGQGINLIILNYYDAGENVVNDTARVVDGKFRFSGKLKHPVHAALIGNKGEAGIDYNNYAQIFMGPGRMTVSVREDDFSGLVLKGSEMQSTMNKLINAKKPVFLQLESNARQQSLLKDSSGTNNQVDSETNEKVRYDQERDSLMKVLAKIEFDFLENHPDSYIAPYLLPGHFTEIPLERLTAVYESWPKRIQESRYGKNVRLMLRKKELSAIQRKAPDFSVRTLAGDSVSLSSFKGMKVVLLDFWASWCVPCRKSFPLLKAIAAGDDAKDLVIIAISIDASAEAWEKAIKEDDTSGWIHVRAVPLPPGKYPDSYERFESYEIPMIPIQYLINKEGVITSKWEGSSAENEEGLRKELKNLLMEKSP